MRLDRNWESAEAGRSVSAALADETPPPTMSAPTIAAVTSVFVFQMRG